MVQAGEPPGRAERVVVVMVEKDIVGWLVLVGWFCLLSECV